MDLRRYIRDIPDFPKPGILFKDITPLLADGKALRWTIDQLAERYRGTVDIVLGIESRGFIIGAALAYALGVGIAIVRKPGKLPGAKYSASYELEYGTDMLEIHRDAFGQRTRVLIVDDLLATGGTATAAIGLAEQLQGRDRRMHLHPRARLPARPRTPGAAPRVLPDPLRLTSSIHHRMESRAPARPVTALSSAVAAGTVSAVADRGARAIPDGQSGSDRKHFLTDARSRARRRPLAGSARLALGAGADRRLLRRRVRRRVADQQPRVALRRGAHAHRRRRPGPRPLRPVGGGPSADRQQDLRVSSRRDPGGARQRGRPRRRRAVHPQRGVGAIARASGGRHWRHDGRGRRRDGREHRLRLPVGAGRDGQPQSTRRVPPRDLRPPRLARRRARRRGDLW